MIINFCGKIGFFLNILNKVLVNVHSNSAAICMKRSFFIHGIAYLWMGKQKLGN